MRTAARRGSRRLEPQALDRRRERSRQLRRGREILSLHFPALRPDTLLFLEPLAFQQVEPAIRARVNEKLEVRIERPLLVNDLRAARIPGVERVEPFVVLRVVMPDLGDRPAVVFGSDFSSRTAADAYRADNLKLSFTLVNPLAVAGRPVAIGR